jgi:hypothetical protein
VKDPRLGSVRGCHASLRQLALTAVREGSGQLVLREIEDRDLGVLFEHATDPEAIRMAAFTSPEADDRPSFDRLRENRRTARMRTSIPRRDSDVWLIYRETSLVARADRAC